MAFAVRAEWKDEPVSITGASYVEPSATDPIKSGQRVAPVADRLPARAGYGRQVTSAVRAAAKPDQPIGRNTLSYRTCVALLVKSCLLASSVAWAKTGA